jgi:hypothetical protein
MAIFDQNKHIAGLKINTLFIITIINKVLRTFKYIKKKEFLFFSKIITRIFHLLKL